jgi:1,2-diacylglycerol 3-beta-glucosyltransferase
VNGRRHRLVDATALVALAPAPLAAYLATLTAAAWWARRRPSAALEREPVTRFAVLVPAHDEEQLVGQTLQSLAAVDYPARLVRVHVVADHCTDRTADVVRDHGVAVHVHDDPEPPGKGPALQWLLRRLVARGDELDAIVVVDADSVLDGAFLREIDAALTSGATVVQGRYTVRDRETSPTTALRAAALDLRHHVRPLGRNALGASAGLYGNGMAFRPDVLLAHPWTGHLTEDLELQIRLLLDGVHVRYRPRGVVAAEMPAAPTDSVSQNERWERGRIDVARRMAPQLLRAAVRPGARDRIAQVDAAVDLIVPPLSVLVAATAGSAVITAGLRLTRPTRITRLAALVSTLSVVALAVHVVAGLRISDAPRSTYRALARAPMTIVWKVRLWARMLTRTSDVPWRRTTRNVERSAA